MENKITKNLIILGAVIFSLILTNNVFADYNPYDSTNWLRPVTSSSTEDYSYNPDSFNNGNQGYSQTGYTQSTTTDPNTGRTTVVNNYYYQATPSNTSKTSTSTTSKTISNQKVASDTSSDTSTKDTKEVDSSNNLGASAYDSQSNGSDITALSLRGSGGFMPSSIWQWILVIILILAIIVISRMLKNKKTVVQESHTTSHSH